MAILRLPLKGPSALQKRHVLVAVSPSTDDAATHPLDLELVATDDVKAYVTTLQHAKIGKYKHDNDACSDAEWQACLKAILLYHHQQQQQDDSLSGGVIDAYAETSDEGYLFIHVQKKVAGSAETLGALKLRRSNAAAETIDIFDWCAEAVRARDKLQQEIAQLKRKHDELQKLVTDETARFKELERSKQEFETEHDSWLKDLLNEKKLKIRMQEQILATANAPQHAFAAAPAAATTTTGHRTAPAAQTGKSGKRKADASVDADLQSDQDVDHMDVDVTPEAAESHDEMSDVGQTTQGSNTPSASEAESEPKPKKGARQQHPRLSPTSPARASRKGPASSSSKQRTPKKEAATSASESDDEPQVVKTTRNSKKNSKKPPPPVFDSDESTASE